MTDQISHLRSVFREQSTETLFIDHLTKRQQSYQQVLQTSSALAEQLRRLGVKKGDYICILADNSLEMLNLFFAIWNVGGCAVPINPQLAKSNIADILNNFEEHLLLVEASHGLLAAEIKGQLTSPVTQSLVSFSTHEHHTEGGLDIAGILSGRLRDVPPSLLFAELDGDAPCMIIFTSGSTNTPKGVSISLNRLVANERLFCRTMGLDAQSRFVHMFPMSYLAGTHNLLLLPICVGGSIVISPPLSGSVLFEFWTIVRDYEINTLWFTATMLSMLLKVDDGADLCWLKDRIRCALVGMAPLPEAIKSAFESRFHVSLYENFALSETAFISTSIPNTQSAPGSKGFVLEHVHVESRNLSNREERLPECVEGELFVKSPFLMLGYFNASVSDNENLVDDGFFTGDIGYIKDGQLYLTGRKKDLIIRGGINIAPGLVESCIASLPDILEVAVVGIEHSDYGEEVAAVVVLSPEAQEMTRRKLQNQLKGKLAYFQQPKNLKLVEEIPKGLTGKIDKKAVKALFEAS